MRRRFTALTVATLASLALILSAAPSALAVAESPDSTWMTNGKVYASVIGGGRIYVGGQFRKLIETPPGTLGSRILARNVGAIGLSSGDGIRRFAPTVDHSVDAPYVNALALSNDGSVLYVGGHFDSVDGVSVRNVAALDTSDGSVIRSLSPRVGDRNNIVYSLLLSPDGSTLYAGGKFRKVEGEVRKNLVAIDTATETPLAGWTPTPDNKVRAMDLADDGDSLYIVGTFDSVDGQARESIARIEVGSGDLHPWAVPGQFISGPPMTGWSVDATAAAIYAGFGRKPNWFGAYDVNTGVQLFRKNTSGNVQKVLLPDDGTELFVGGHFGTGRLTQTFNECGSTQFYGLLSANPATGTVNCTWSPELDPHGRNYDGIWDLDLSPAHLWLAGKFSSVEGVDQANVARLDR